MYKQRYYEILAVAKGAFSPVAVAYIYFCYKTKTIGNAGSSKKFSYAEFFCFERSEKKPIKHTLNFNSGWTSNANKRYSMSL